MASPIEELGRLLQEVGATVRFGLRQQGKYDRVTALRAEGKSWDEIGREIGWSGSAVEQCYAIEAGQEGDRG